MVNAQGFDECADLLKLSAESEVYAAEALKADMPAKGLKAELEQRGVPSSKVNSFLGVYRAYRQGLSMGYKPSELLKAGTAKMRILGDKDAKQTREAFDVAMDPTSKPDDVLKLANPAKYAARMQAKAAKDTEQAMSKAPVQDQLRHQLCNVLLAMLTQGMDVKAEIEAVLKPQTAQPKAIEALPVAVPALKAS